MTFFSPLLEHAIELAAQWHDHTYRKSQWRNPAFEPPDGVVPRVPVMAHVTAVALNVQRAGWNDVTVAAAFLHDVLEDGNRYGQTFRREWMIEQVGLRVTQLVLTVTEQKLDEQGHFLPWRVRKEGYLAQLRSGTPEACAISLADKVHNLWSMNESLASGLDVFTSGPNRKALSAGPAEQRWFNEAVLSASMAHSDDRLPPMQARLQEAIDRFKDLTESG